METMSIVRGYAAVVPSGNAATQKGYFTTLPGRIAEQEYLHKARVQSSAMHGIIAGSPIGSGVYLLLGVALYAAVH
jgi:hypothetical protein